MAVAAGPDSATVEETAAEEESGVLEPGAAPFGNFPHYSRFHPPEQRLRLLPPELLRRLFPHSSESRPILGLDVGCNSGESWGGIILNQLRLEFLRPLSALRHHRGTPGRKGHDAWALVLATVATDLALRGDFHIPTDLSVALYRHFLSLHDGQTCSDVSKELRFLCCDIDPALVDRARKECPFPDALTFITLDFMNQRTRKVLLNSFLSQFGRSVFDIGFCMSVTMWIHLNHGDQGLWEFLAHLSSLCHYLLVEPQPWKCYRAAARRVRKLGLHSFDHFRSLAIRGDMANQIVRLLTQDHGMELVCCFGSTSWDRSLLLFRAKQTIETHPIPESLIEEENERDRLKFWRH